MKTMHLFRKSLILASAFILAAATMVRAEEPVIVLMFDTPAKYKPDPVKIKAGQTIKWVNKGETVHTATADPAQAPDPSWVSVPAGAENFDSGYMNAGESWSYTFKVPGVYKYFCLTHEQEGMKGEVDVEK